MSLADLTRNAFQSGLFPAKASDQGLTSPKKNPIFDIFRCQWVSLCQMFLWRGNAPHTLALAGLEAEITSQ